MKLHTIATIGELCHVSIGRTPRRSESRYWDGPHPWATVRDLDGQTLTFTKQGITDAALKEVMPKHVEPGTLLFSFKLSIGKVALAGRKLHHNEAIAALPIRDPTVLDRDFLFHVLQIKTHDSNANHAVLGKVLNKRKIEEIEIPLPSLDEQRRIASILNRAAQIERLRAQATARLHEFVPALFIKMFGDPMQYPKRWELKQLGDLFYVRGGKRLPRGSKYTDHQTSYRYIRAADIIAGEVRDTDAKYISEDLHNRISRYVVGRSDTLLTIAGKIGVAAPVNEEIVGSNLTENAVRLTPIIEYHANNIFLSAQLNSEFLQTQIRIRTGQVTIGKLAIERIKTMKIFIPPINLQNRYASLIADARIIFAATKSSAKVASALTKSLAACMMPNNL